MSNDAIQTQPPTLLHLPPQKNPKGRSVGAKGYTISEIDELIKLVNKYPKLSSETWRDIEKEWNETHENKRFADSLRKKYNTEIKKMYSPKILAKDASDTPNAHMQSVPLIKTFELANEEQVQQKDSPSTDPPIDAAMAASPTILAMQPTVITSPATAAIANVTNGGISANDTDNSPSINSKVSPISVATSHKSPAITEIVPQKVIRQHNNNGSSNADSYYDGGNGPVSGDKVQSKQGENQEIQQIEIQVPSSVLHHHHKQKSRKHESSHKEHGSNDVTRVKFNISSNNENNAINDNCDDKQIMQNIGLQIAPQNDRQLQIPTKLFDGDDVNNDVMLLSQSHSQVSGTKRRHSEIESHFLRLENSINELRAKIAKLEKSIPASGKKSSKDGPCKIGHNYQLINQSAVFCTKCGSTKKLGLK